MSSTAPEGVLIVMDSSCGFTGAWSGRYRVKAVEPGRVVNENALQQHGRAGPARQLVQCAPCIRLAEGLDLIEIAGAAGRAAGMRPVRRPHQAVWPGLDQRHGKFGNVVKIGSAMRCAIRRRQLYVRVAALHQLDHAGECRLLFVLLVGLDAGEVVEHHGHFQRRDIDSQFGNHIDICIDLYRPAEGSNQSLRALQLLQRKAMVALAAHLQVQADASHALSMHGLQHRGRDRLQVDHGHTACPFAKPAQRVEQCRVVKAVDARLYQHDAIDTDALLKRDQVDHTGITGRVRAPGREWETRAVEDVDVTITTAGRRPERWRADVGNEILVHGSSL
ncbi:hypothetical protein CBM2618_B130082 [Cupriavidus taiwanensis]|nr:hypothetical protein CBM2591_B80406 [Cupriavidus taiwanensis]SOZ85284.1 hypothetical protein CBM2618_B130082 [Cupriavidus taiwanensis]SOZ88715.1 hypothetical protein CBM2622_B140084 [Cupriavidus taiwanensis]